MISLIGDSSNNEKRFLIFMANLSNSSSFHLDSMCTLVVQRHVNMMCRVSNKLITRRNGSTNNFRSFDEKGC